MSVQKSRPARQTLSTETRLGKEQKIRGAIEKQEKKRADDVQVLPVADLVRPQTRAPHFPSLGCDLLFAVLSP